MLSLFLLAIVPCVISNGDDKEFFNLHSVAQETSLSPADFAAAARLRRFDAPPTNNPLLLAKKFEGDIDGIERGAAGNAMRNAVRQSNLKWPGGVVPYTISSQYTSRSRALIAAAITDYHSKTCLRFVSRSTQTNYVYIAPDRGCYSMVGMVGGRQTVSIGSGCMYKGIIEHELMHAVGFFHEQSRADRDDYVRIHWENIYPGMQGQFEKYTLQQIQHLGAAYDYASIMHYSSTDFSRNGQPTITPLQSSTIIGQRTHLSRIDLQKLNALYGCSAGQTTPQPTWPTQATCSDNYSDCVRWALPTWSRPDPCRYGAFVNYLQRNCRMSCKLC